MTKSVKPIVPSARPQMMASGDKRLNGPTGGMETANPLGPSDTAVVGIEAKGYSDPANGGGTHSLRSRFSNEEYARHVPNTVAVTSIMKTNEGRVTCGGRG